MLEDVEEDDRVRIARRLVELLKGLLFQIDLEALAARLHRPPRRLDASRAPARAPRRVQKESHIGADLEKAIAADGIAGHHPEHPLEELASALFLAQVGLIDDIGVPAEYLLAGERGA
jgi:hypothetical protein